MLHISLADAQEKLAELIAQVAEGETVLIVEDGGIVAQISAPSSPSTASADLVERRRKHIEDLREQLVRMPKQDEPAGDFIRRMRDEERY